MDEYENQDEGQALTVGAMTSVIVDTVPMIAALSVVDPTRAGCNGVYLHSVDTVLRIVATDGHRLFLHAREHGEHEPEWPAWLADGVLIPVSGLKARLGMIDAETRTKGSQSGVAKVSYAIEAPYIEISDPQTLNLFRFRLGQSRFPEYQKVLDKLTSFDAVKSDEMASTAFDSRYIRAVGELAKTLGSERTDAKNKPLPPHIRVHAGSGAEGPTLITFPDYAGAMLVLMPVKDQREIAAPVMRVLAAPLAGTIAALRAHKTRWERKSGPQAARKVAEYEERIAALLAGIAAPVALPAPEPEPEPEEVPDLDVSFAGALEPDEELYPGLQESRSRLTPAVRLREMRRFVADINALLGAAHGLTISQLADGVPVEDWFDAGLTPLQASLRSLDWRRIGSVLPADEVLPGEADKPIGLLQSGERAKLTGATAPEREAGSMVEEGEPAAEQEAGSIDPEPEPEAQPEAQPTPKPRRWAAAASRPEKRVTRGAKRRK